MPETTLTINHADGGSETYTINRDKFEGVRNMTVDGAAVSVDRSKPDNIRTLLMDGQTITIDTSAEGVRTLTIDGNTVTIDRSDEIEIIKFVEEFGQPALAYSLRDLNQGGSVVNVRRSSDNADSDFTAAEILNGTLVSWVGAGNNGFVTAWYDQSGNDNHALQPIEGNQPQIVDLGELIDVRPTIDLYGICGQSNAAGFAPVADAGTRFNALDALDTARIFRQSAGETEKFVFNGNQNLTTQLGNTLYGPESECLNLAASASQFAAVVKYAISATSLYNEWDSDTGSLYSQFVADYNACVADLEGRGFRVRHRGVLFGQGESDAAGTLGGGASNYYEDKQRDFIQNLRKDLKVSDLPIALTLITLGASQTSNYPDTATVNTAKTNVATSESNVTLIDSSSYTFIADDIHYDGAAQITLGAAFYAAATGTSITGVRRVGVRMDGTSSSLPFTSLNLADFCIHAVVNPTDVSGQNRIVGGSSNGNNGWGHSNGSTIFFRADAGSAAGAALPFNLENLNPYCYTLSRDASNTISYTVNGVDGGANPVRTETFQPDAIGGSVLPFEGVVSEIIVFGSDQSSVHHEIEQNINDHYSIF